MASKLISTWIESVPALDEAAMEAARARQQTLTKPPGSLGDLEAISIRLAGIQARPVPAIGGKAVVVMAGDHGVVVEGVSAYPQDVTGQMLLNFLEGGAAINVLARAVGAQVAVVDMGVAAGLPQRNGFLRPHIGDGTANLARGPAMAREQAVRAVEAGGRVALDMIHGGVDLLACGDMGIGNTTSSAAIIAAMVGHSVEEVVGPGTGVSGEALRRKVAVVARALAHNLPDPRDALDVLAKVGGFEIGGIAGAMLAAATQRCAVVVDGVISAAGALIACGLQPRVRDYLFAGHLSVEPGHAVALGALELKPLLDLGLRLGEGTGAVLAMPLIEAAARVLAEMATFESAGVSGREGS